MHGPRPSGKIRPDQLPLYEDGNWLVQRKFNGQKTTLHIQGNSVKLFNKGKLITRHLPNLKKDLVSSGFGEDTWLDGELCDQTLILYEILQHRGKFLLGITQIDRLKLLYELCGSPTDLCDSGIALKVKPSIFLAEFWESNFSERYLDFLSNDLIEGLVLRKKSAKFYNLCLSPSETTDQIRCRKNCGKYRF